jgi:hypothetical protein
MCFTLPLSLCGWLSEGLWADLRRFMKSKYLSSFKLSGIGLKGLRMELMVATIGGKWMPQSKIIVKNVDI